MRWLLLVLSAVGLNGCQPATDPSQSGPCPRGSQLNGEAPPQGQAQWCQRRDAKGEWINHGPFESWFPNGVLQARGTYDNGEMVGRFEMFYANRNRSVVVERVDGERDGDSWSWHMNGRPAIAAHFVEGQEQGPWMSWWEEGTTSAYGVMKDGWEDGLWLFWHPSGAPSHRGRYTMGKRQGWWERWDSDGRPLPQTLYEDNKELRQGPLAARPNNDLRKPPKPSPRFAELVEEWNREQEQRRTHTAIQ